MEPTFDPLWNLHAKIRRQFPTSPHYLFDDKKNYYSQIKKFVDEMYDAEFEVAQASKNLHSALRPMGINYHYFNYLAPFYGALYKALRQFEKVIKKTTPELKAYYKDLVLPDSKSIFTLMHKEMEFLTLLVAEEHYRTLRNNPNWVPQDACVIFEDQINELYKEACKDKDKK